MVSMTTQIIDGQRMVFLLRNSIDILEQGSILMVITTHFVERLYEDAIEQQRHQAKGMMKQRLLEPRTTQARLQACCSRWNDKMRKIDVSFAHRRKVVLRE